MRRCFARLRRTESGAAAVEFAFVAMVAIALFLGIIEFGRGLYMRNAMSFAADVAARKILTNPAVTNSDVEAAIRDAIAFGSSSDLTVTFGTETVDGVSFRNVLVRYPVTLLVPDLVNNDLMLSVARRVPLG